MLLGQKLLIFKVDPVTTGSRTLTVATENTPLGHGATGARHRTDLQRVRPHEDQARPLHRGMRINVQHVAQLGLNAATGRPALEPSSPIACAVRRNTLTKRWRLSVVAHRRSDGRTLALMRGAHIDFA